MRTKRKQKLIKPSVPSIYSFIHKIRGEVKMSLRLIVKKVQVFRKFTSLENNHSFHSLWAHS